MQVGAYSFEPLISASEAGQLLGVHPVTLLRWAREGRVTEQLQHRGRHSSELP